MNLRDLGGWRTPTGATLFGRLYRSDRLSDLSPTDLRQLEERRIVTVIDLRYEAEVAQHPSKLWSTVAHHHEIPMGGDLADQRTFVDRIFHGELDEITDEDVAESYVEMLDTHARDLGRAVNALLTAGPALYHCTAGKDRTGLLTMLVLAAVGVSDDDILADFVLSNRYRASRRIEQLRPSFEARGIDIDRFRPGLSAPGPALTAAMEWLSSSFGSPDRYLSEAGGVEDAGRRLRQLLVDED
jgi:protein-tyrosine phosphatase